ncbi:hypothetical protein [Nocardioides sp. zg-1228]|uniref:hypothetical protein n=1 Tax=Nocardioides sp. zg-1228 TaxID=2763008 RepID=UPI001642F764|nr:hypothetical protein [Nocardioides sp. zg-1228]MBC2933991.1 hypothetical protein [Nocardioides sp. zg-1228]QSF58748.1 hypothetical protein JX575_06060 [Nocardioides sp. zg-1228]
MPSLATRAVVRSFAALAAARSAPAFHPRGVVYEGRAEVHGAGPLPVGVVHCLVRLSKGIGTPRGVPDLLGLGVRLLHDPPVDVLCTTAPGGARWQRYLLAPGMRWGGATLTSLMWWRSPSGERLQVVVDVPDPRLDSPEPDVLVGRLPVDLTLRVVGAGGDVQTATVRVERRSEAPRPDLDPVLHRPRPWRLGPHWLAAVRERAYVGSRAGQPRKGGEGAH